MEYEVILENEELIFYQKHDAMDSASQYEEEEDEDRHVHPDDTYFYFGIPLTNIRRISSGYFKADVHEIVLRDDETYTVKIYNPKGYTFKLELPEETYNSVLSILESAVPKKAGRKTRRRLSPKKH
jgi:hypothetical protein